MKHVIAAVALICMSGAATLSFAQEAKKADPNGTWKWTTECSPQPVLGCVRHQFDAPDP